MTEVCIETKKLIKKGLRPAEIAVRLDVSRSTIARALKGLGLPHSPPGPRGPSSLDDYERALALMKRGATVESAARETDIRERTLYRWMKSGHPENRVLQDLT